MNASHSSSVGIADDGKGSQCLNTHSPHVSGVLNCNTNVSTGDVAQLMYQTLYVSKNTQEDDSFPMQIVAALGYNIATV